MQLDRTELTKIVGEAERSLFAAIAASQFDDETAAFACLSAIARCLCTFMDPKIVAAILYLRAQDIAAETEQLTIRERHCALN